MRGVAIAGAGLLLVGVAVIGWELFGVWSPLTASLVGVVFLAVHRDDHARPVHPVSHTVQFGAGSRSRRRRARR